MLLSPPSLPGDANKAEDNQSSAVTVLDIDCTRVLILSTESHLLFVSVSVHTLPNLTVLSLSGCSKITDDGIELIAENLRKLRSLDVSWCPRVTDAALEYIACDLNHLEELTLDRLVACTPTCFPIRHP